jgi:hypothetical protein
LIKVSLEYAVGAIERAVRADVEDMITAAKVFTGSRTGLEKLAGKRKEPKGLLVQIKLFRAALQTAPLLLS